MAKRFVMPDRALAADVSLTLGRLLDEMLISMLLLNAGYASFANWHADPMLELADDLVWSVRQLYPDAAMRLPVGGETSPRGSRLHRFLGS